jgi:predicted RNase H-like nuclease (RuvC/YqgF family)
LCGIGDDNHVSYVESSRYESETQIEQTTRIIGELSSQLENARKRLEELKNKRNLDLLDSLGDRAVVRFSRKFNRGGTIYHYAAIKLGSWWYITSDGTEYKRTTESLKLFIGENRVDIMTPDKSL